MFKNRTEAGKKLAQALAEDKDIQNAAKRIVIFSLIRGGAPVGHEVTKRLQCSHYPLVVKKIGAPHQEELAIGAVCDGEVFLHKNLIKRIGLSKSEIDKQIREARTMEKNYLKRFKIKRAELKDKIAILVDDGVATGASTLAACQCLRAKGAAKVFLAVPVAPTDFDPQDESLFDGVHRGFDRAFILHRDPFFHAVGQYYREFHQVSDSEAFRFFK